MTETHATILIVDDAPENLSLAVRVLEHADYTTLVAERGKDALDIVARQPVDLILLDIMMPGMSGFEVCKALKGMPQSADIPIIFLTSLNDAQNITTGFEIGGVDYLVKPFQRLELTARIAKHLQLKAMHRSLADANRQLHEQNILLQRQAQEFKFAAQRLQACLVPPLQQLAQPLQRLQSCLQDSGDTEAAEALSQLSYISSQMHTDMESIFTLLEHGSIFRPAIT